MELNGIKYSGVLIANALEEKSCRLDNKNEPNRSSTIQTSKNLIPDKSLEQIEELEYEDENENEDKTEMEVDENNTNTSNSNTNLKELANSPKAKALISISNGVNGNNNNKNSNNNMIMQDALITT